jgi:1-acyl-sn-glycerol-3-phosphate acyltransferase
MPIPVKFTSPLERIVSKAWLLYFLLTIAGIGLPLAWAISTPLYLLGYLWHPAVRAADRVMGHAIHLLMSVQPWLSAEIDISIPDARLRKTGYLLVSNHRSHLDSFLLLSRVPGIRILAKKSLFYVPFLGLMMRLTRQIPTERGKLGSFWTAIEVIRENLRRGEAVHVFPEMTRCPPGFVGTQDFLTAPFLTAIQEKVPVLPIAFKGTDAAWPKGYFGLWRAQPISAKKLEIIDPSQFTSAEALRDETRRRINEALI